jgi:UPF0755 protein
MTIRGGGRPRDSGAHAYPYDGGEERRAQPWSRDPRRSANGRRPRNGGGGGFGGVLRFLVFALVLAGIVLTVLLTVLRPVVADAVVGWAYDNPTALRIPFVESLVRERLGTALTEPVSADPTDVTFTVREGDTVESVAARLREQGFISDPRAFIFQATVDDLAPDLETGNFRLARSMPPADLVRGLVENRITIVIVPKTFRESLRIDQMATLIQTWQAEGQLTVDAAEFRELATEPPAELLADYPWLQSGGLPEGASLEGYLFPSTYDLRVETTAEQLIRMMLDQFAEEVGAERAAEATFYERLILASLVEREAQLDEERALIAGAYQNRLDGSGSEQVLGADPTVIYAADTVALAEIPFEQWVDYRFWTVPEGSSLAELPLPEELERYNTYRNRGLPPGPICAPGIASIEAALSPDTDEGFKFFVAIPEGGGTHDFSKTFEEHQQKLQQYGYT